MPSKLPNSNNNNNNNNKNNNNNNKNNNNNNKNNKNNNKNNNNNKLVQQFSNPQPNKLPRQPFQLQNSNDSIYHLSKNPTLRVKQSERDHEVKENVKQPRSNSVEKPKASGRTSSSKGQESKVEAEWQSAVDDIFNSALSLHELENKVNVSSKPS